MANPVSPSLPASPAPVRPEDRYPPLMRAVFDALSAFIDEIEDERMGKLAAYLRWSDEQSEREACFPIDTGVPTFVCKFHLNSLRCNVAVVWIEKTAVLSCSIYEMSPDFQDRGKAYLDFLNLSGMSPSVEADSSTSVLQCTWKITSHAEMENALSAFEDLFKPQRWPEQLAEAYLRGAEALPLFCSRLDTQKKLQVIILTLDIFSKLVERKEDIPHVPKCLYNCCMIKDPQVQYRIGPLFRTLIGEGKGLQEASKSALQMILNADVEVKCEGVRILIALVGKGFFSPESLSAVAPFYHADKQLGVEVREFIAQLFARGHKKEVLDTAIKLLRDLYDPCHRFGVVLFEELFKRGIGFAQAREQVFPLFSPPLAAPPKPSGMPLALFRSLFVGEDRPRVIDEYKLNLFRLLMEHEQCLPEAMENARSLIRSRHPSETEYGLTIYQALISLEKGCEQAEEDAVLRFQSTNAVDKKLSLRLLEFLAKKGKACGTATRFAVEAFKSSAFDLRMFGILLLQILVASGHALKEATECAAIAVDRSKTKEMFNLQKEMMKEGFNLLTLLVNKGEAIEIAKRWAADSKDGYIKEKEEWQINLYAALVGKEHAYKEATKAAVAGAHGITSVKVKCVALGILKQLVKRGESIPEASEVLKFGWSDDKDIDRAYTDLYRALNRALHK